MNNIDHFQAQEEAGLNSCGAYTKFPRYLSKYCLFGLQLQRRSLWRQIALKRSTDAGYLESARPQPCPQDS